MNKVLVVCDVNWWVFHKIYKGIKNNISSQWKIDVQYTRQNPTIKHENYHVILFLCDFQFNLLKTNKIPANKTILAIRSNRTEPFYSDSVQLTNSAKIIAASNKKFYNRYSKLHPNVVLAPGGVDSDKFSYKSPNPQTPLRIGWAGSKGNFGEPYRGINIIKQACEEEGYHFDPAIRENKMRNENEMVEYYHNNIDIYVDLSVGGGRQNGILEAGCCGLPVIATNVGIIPELITEGVNGYILYKRNKEELKNKIKSVNFDTSLQLRHDIEQKWSWAYHTKIFENMFEEIING